MSLVRRVRESLKFRLFFAYCRRLERRKRRCLPSVSWPSQVQPNLSPLLVVTCESDIPLLCYSLSSLQRTTSKLPELWLVGDSDQATDALQRQFDGAPASVRVGHWKNYHQQLRPLEQRFVNSWVNSKPWGGYARKFAVTVAANRQSAVLLSDADVLWKKDFLSTLQPLLAAQPSILAGHDEPYAYDRSLAEALQSRIFSAPPLNCGFVYYSRGVLDATLQEPEYKIAQQFAANATNHLEQTLIARAFEKAKGAYFHTAHVATTLADNFCLRENVHSEVRHYAGAKHLFWRDA